MSAAQDPDANASVDLLYLFRSFQFMFYAFCDRHRDENVCYAAPESYLERGTLSLALVGKSWPFEWGTPSPLS